jgi:hypothetical protein
MASVSALGFSQQRLQAERAKCRRLDIRPGGGRPAKSHAAGELGASPGDASRVSMGPRQSSTGEM